MGGVESVVAVNPTLMHRTGLKALPHIGQLGSPTQKPELDFALMFDRDSLETNIVNERTYPTLYRDARRFRFVRCNLGAHACLAELDVDSTTGRLRHIRVFTINAEAVQQTAQALPFFARIADRTSPVRVVPYDSIEQHWLGAYFGSRMDDDWAAWVVSKLYIDKWTSDELLAKLQHGSLLPASYVDAWRDPLLAR